MVAAVLTRVPATEVAGLRARRALDALEKDVQPDVLDVLRLLVTELVINSLRHGGLEPDDSVGITVRMDDRLIRVEVTDAGPGFEPPPREVPPSQSSGFGLLLVDRMAKRWGVESGPETRVWFEIATSPPAAEGSGIS